MTGCTITIACFLICFFLSLSFAMFIFPNCVRPNIALRPRKAADYTRFHQLFPTLIRCLATLQQQQVLLAFRVRQVGQTFSLQGLKLLAALTFVELVDRSEEHTS